MSGRAAYRKRFACVDCGTPVGMPDSRCPDCRKVYKRAYNRRYLRDYHARTRPSPAPKPQRRGDLPLHGEMLVSDDGSEVYCHVCGKGYGSLVSHVRTHGLTAATYKARYGLARGTSLLSPATAERFRAAALARNQGEMGRAVLAEIGPNPREPGIANRLQSRVRSSVNSARRTDGVS